MATRQYNFTVGPETSQQPDVGTPASDDDLINRGYADERYAQGASAKANIAAIKAIVAADRRDGDLVVNLNTNLLYVFDAGSGATGDDDLVLTPDAGTGRWLKIGTTAGSAIDLTSDVTGVLPIANGGSNASTATPAFDNLSPTTSKGDIIANDGTNNTRLAVGPNGLVLKANSSTSTGLEWGSASSGSGEVNYITNFDGEDETTTGYATYDDGSSATPVDGTGGTSSNLTFSNQAGTVLRGNRSFLLAKANSADSQGEGFSQDFTIPSWEPPRKSKIEFTYDASDANYTAGDLVVYIYDVTNSILITPADTSIPNNSDIFQTTFDSNGGGSYRFIVHVATTTTNNWNVYFDRIIVGPGMTSQGAAVGSVNLVDIDGTDFTNDTGLTIDGRVSYQRVGDSLHVTFSAETPGNGSDSGALTFDLATAINQNITFTSGAYGAGVFGFYNATNADRFTLAARFVADGTGTLQFTQVEGDTSTGLAGTGFGQNAGDREIIQITALLPVAEWAGKGIVPMLSEDNLSQWQLRTDSSMSNLSTNIDAEGGSYKRLGDSVVVRASIEFSGTNTEGAINPSLPNSLTSDSSKFFNTGLGTGSEDRVTIGTWSFYDVSFGYTYNGSVAYDVSADLIYLLASNGANNIVDTSANVPTAIADGDVFSWQFEMPVVEYAGSQNSLVAYSEADGTNNGLLPPVTSMSDALAAQLGYKVYDGAGVDETITESIDSSTVSYAQLIPYQMQDGSWRLKFNIADDPTGTSTSYTLTFANTTFANVGVSAGQAVTVTLDLTTGTVTRAKADDNASTISVAADTAFTRITVSGDVALASKPSWVD